MFIVTSPRSGVRARETESNGAAFNPLSLVRSGAGAGDATSRALCRAKFDTHAQHKTNIRKYFHDYEMFTISDLTLTIRKLCVNVYCKTYLHSVDKTVQINQCTTH